jgi:hypothetical protein
MLPGCPGDVELAGTAVLICTEEFAALARVCWNFVCAKLIVLVG